MRFNQLLYVTTMIAVLFVAGVSLYDRYLNLDTRPVGPHCDTYIVSVSTCTDNCDVLRITLDKKLVGEYYIFKKETSI